MTDLRVEETLRAEAEALAAEIGARLFRTAKNLLGNT